MKWRKNERVKTSAASFVPRLDDETEQVCSLVLARSADDMRYGKLSRKMKSKQKLGRKANANSRYAFKSLRESWSIIDFLPSRRYQLNKELALENLSTWFCALSINQCHRFVLISPSKIATYFFYYIDFLYLTHFSLAFSLAGLYI